MIAYANRVSRMMPRKRDTSRERKGESEGTDRGVVVGSMADSVLSVYWTLPKKTKKLSYCGGM